MKYYIATKIENALAHNVLCDRLNQMGHEITYDWTKQESLDKGTCTEVAINEAKGIIDCDFFVMLGVLGRGTHVELGMAIALNKTIFHIHNSDKDCVFYYHPRVTQYKIIDELLRYL